MHNDIISAIRALPEHLFTPEIARAAIESNDINALNYIPSRFLTMEEMVENLIENNMKTWSSFDLARLPVEWRTREICEFAFKNDVNNIKAFPERFISREIAKTVVSCGSGHFNILSYIPASLWDAELAYIALNNKTVSNSYKVDHEGDYRRMQIVLRYVPESVKTKSFYLGMFRELKAECYVLSRLVPNKYKNKKYYMELAKRDLSLVPEQYISYETLYCALLSEYQSPHNRAPKFKRYFPFLDDFLADRLVMKEPYIFLDLPQRFQTSERLIIAIECMERIDIMYFAEEVEQRLLTPEVCKAFIRKNLLCPKFPDNVWTKEFVDYCMEHGTSFLWFKQMPQRFQTSANTQAAYNYNAFNVYHFAKRFITPQMAKRCHRNTFYKDAVPKLYLEEFKKQTGLPEEFYGGECSLLSLKNAKVDYSYCKIGNTYLAFYTKDCGRTDKPYLMMTRTESRYCTPEKVFDVPIGTFHHTWLEKIVSQKDPQFVKPKVDRSLRAVQALCYYGVEKIKDINRTEIFRNTFMGETIGYCARRRNLTYHCDECENLLVGLKYKMRGMAVPTILVDECFKYSADMLHQKLGFCYAGMTSFATDYGLDMDKSYSIREMRQIVNEIGYKPSLSSYRKELKKLNII